MSKVHIDETNVIRSSRKKENFFAKMWIFTVIFFGILIIAMIISNQLTKSVLVVNSDGSILYAQAIPIDMSEELHKKMGRDAAEALLMRNPRGLDNRELFDVMFIGEANDQALKELNLNRGSYSERRIHQKLEVADIVYSKRDDGAIEITVLGQVILNGLTSSKYVKKPFQYAKNFELIMDLVKNPNSGTDLYAPYVVPNYTIEYTKKNAEMEEDLIKEDDEKGVKE